MTTQNHYERHFNHCGRYLPDAEKWVKEVRESGRSVFRTLMEENHSLVPGAMPLNEARRYAANLSCRIHEGVKAHVQESGGLKRALEYMEDSAEYLEVCSFGASVFEDDPIRQEHTTRLTAMISFHLAIYDLEGKRSYQISSGLAEKLRHTELRGLRSEDLRLPYACVYVEVPTSLGFFIEGEGLRTTFTGAYITELPPSAGEPRAWNIILIGESRKICVGNQVHSNSGLHIFSLSLEDGKPLDDAIEGLSGHKLSEGSSDVDGLTSPTLAFRWLMNLVLYATWPDAEVEHVTMNKEARQLWRRIQKAKVGSAKRKGLLQRFNELDPRKRIVLGRSIRVDRAQPKVASATGSGNPLVVRTRVSGHWRNQPHGPGRSLRRRQWIEPFWRGPEDGPLGPSVHRLTMTQKGDLKQGGLDEPDHDHD